MSEAAVLLSGIVKRFRGIPALAGVDLEVPVGSVFALLGPNGAGKTTTLRIIMGLVRPDAGSGRVLGVYGLPTIFPRYLESILTLSAYTSW